MKNLLQQMNMPGGSYYPTMQQLKQLVDAIPDVICAVNPAGKFIYVSQAATSVFGYTPDELVGKSFTELVVPEDQEKTGAISQRIMQGQRVTHFENRYCRKDGSVVPLTWSAQWDAQEEVMFCIARNNSEKKEQERLQQQYEGEIKQKNAELQDMLECITDGFFALDGEWRFLYGNGQVEKMLNIRREDYLHRKFLDCFPEMQDSVFYQQYQKAMQEAVAVQFEAFFPRFNRWFAVHAYPSKTGLSVLFRDTTETKREEERRKAYEKQIEQQNRRLVGIMEHMHQGFISMDRQLQVQYFNRMAAAILQVSRQEVLGWKFTDWLRPEAKEFYQPLFAQAIKEGQPLSREHKCPQSGKWIEWNLYPTEEGFSVFFRDIDARKQTEEELKKLSLITRETASTVIVTDMHNRITWVNDAFTRSTGYTLAEVLGKQTGELLNGPETSTAVVDYMHAQRAKGKPYHAEVLNYKKNGEQFWSEVYAQPVLDAAGKVAQYFSIESDITERKRNENELRKLSLVAQQTDNIVAIINRDKKIEWVNAAFTRITGYSFEEAIGRYSYEVFDGPDTDEAVVKYVQERWEQKLPVHVEALNYKKNGETYWADVNSQPVFDEAGTLQHFFSIATDITERKKLQQVLEQEKRRRQQMVTAAAITAQERERAQVGRELHDNVNQVLTTVKLYQELCLSGIGSREELIQKSIQLLQESINEIRSLSKRLSAPTLGSIKLKDSLMELVDVVAATNKIRITLDTAPTENLDVDQEVHLAIYRILQEHLTNVLKHADAENVSISLQKKGGELVLQVSDDGKGFDVTTKRNGIGIGNMTSRAESVKGRLHVASAPGRGCVLTAYIPV